MFNFFKRKKTKVKPKSMRKEYVTLEWTELGIELCEIMSKSDHVTYSFLAKHCIEHKQYNAFLDVMCDIMEHDEELIKKYVGDEIIKKMWDRIYKLSK